MNWHEILVPRYPLEMVVRGSLVYIGLLILLRVILKRQAGKLATSDLLVMVLIADAIQNAMAGDYKSIPDGLILVSTILFWDFVLDWITFRFPALNRFMTVPPLLLVQNGKLLRRNMRREFVNESEIRAKVREAGFEDLSQVKAAYLESDGEISVLGR